MKFEKAPDKINRGISMLIYADPGVGKTTLASTLPPDETIIINTEAGLGPLLGKGHALFNLNQAGKGDVDKVFGDVEQVEGIYRFLRTQKHPFKYVVVDNVSELEQWIILSLTQHRGKAEPEIKEYGDCAYKMREYLHLFRDLIYQDINVIFNAWEFPLEIRNTDGCVITKTFPKLAKKISPEICGIVDVVGHLEIHHKSGRRWVRFGPSEQFITKSQFKGLDPLGEPPDLPTIFSKLKEFNYGEKDVQE